MKRILTLLLITGMMLPAIQSFAQVKFGPRLGLNMANMAFNYKDSQFEPKTKMKLGYSIGGLVEFTFTDMFGLQTGLFLSSKGATQDLDEDLGMGVTIEGTSKVSLNYLEIPILAECNISGFQIYAGPYVGIGLFGKAKWDVTTKGLGMEVSTSGDDKIKFKNKVSESDLNDSTTSYTRMLDMGLNFGIGYKVGPVLINAGYSLGLGNLEPSSDLEGYKPEDWKSSNRVITLTVAYLFGE